MTPDKKKKTDAPVPAENPVPETNTNKDNLWSQQIDNGVLFVYDDSGRDIKGTYDVMSGVASIFQIEDDQVQAAKTLVNSVIAKDYPPEGCVMFPQRIAELAQIHPDGTRYIYKNIVITLKKMDKPEGGTASTLAMPKKPVSLDSTGVKVASMALNQCAKANPILNKVSIKYFDNGMISIQSPLFENNSMDNEGNVHNMDALAAECMGALKEFLFFRHLPKPVELPELIKSMVNERPGTRFIIGKYAFSYQKDKSFSVYNAETKDIRELPGIDSLFVKTRECAMFISEMLEDDFNDTFTLRAQKTDAKVTKVLDAFGLIEEEQPKHKATEGIED